MNPVLALACAFAFFTVASAQTCAPEVVFLLDQSENAFKAASSGTTVEGFDILRDAIYSFVNSPLLSPTLTRIGAYGYSGGADQSTFINEGSNPASANNQVPNIFTPAQFQGGSWTYRGLNMIENGPQTTNNLLIIVSSLGSGKYEQASSEYQRVTAMGWNTYVIAVQGDLDIDFTELNIVNGGQSPELLNSATAARLGVPVPSSYYTFLDEALQDVLNSILCVVPVTVPPFDPVVVPTTTPGVCNKCVAEGGFMLATVPYYCDAFYMCLSEGSEPILTNCPAGTFFNGERCDFRNSVTCNLAPCEEGGLYQDKKYESGRCCNKYYRCDAGVLREEQCPDGSYFNNATKVCESHSDYKAVCNALSKFICDVENNTVVNCGEFRANEFGNPCKYWHGTEEKTVPAGTVWSQQICGVVHDWDGICDYIEPGARFYDGDKSDVCDSVFRAAYDFYLPSVVYSERESININSYVTMNAITMTPTALQYTSTMSNPYLYYYYFNDVEFPYDIAFKLRFRLEDAVINQEYDLLSNNFCAACAATISFTIRELNTGAQVVTVNFIEATGSSVVTLANVVQPPQSVDEELELIVIYGSDSVYGEVSVISVSSPDSNALRTYQLTPRNKGEEVKIKTTKCGLQIGRGPTNSFVGTIDDFAVYSHCTDIGSVLRV